MKTTILTIATFIAVVFGTTQSTFAANKDNEEVTVLTEATHINKIEVHGNVEVFVSNGTNDEVKVYNNYYANSALVQDVNGVLRISSYKAKKLVVWVTANGLRTLNVYDNAEVKSFGKLNALDLDVKLYNNASAQLDLDAYHAKVSLSDKAKADLTGTADESEMSYDQSSYLNSSSFAAAHLTKTVNLNSINSNTLELVSL